MIGRLRPDITRDAQANRKEECCRMTPGGDHQRLFAGASGDQRGPDFSARSGMNELYVRDHETCSARKFALLT
jgi:hypothetical protein